MKIMKTIAPRKNMIQKHLRNALRLGILLLCGSCKEQAVDSGDTAPYRYYEGEQIPNTEEFYAMDEQFSLNACEFNRAGTEIVYTKFTNRSQWSRLGVFIYNVQTTEERLLTLDGYFPSWSPDGSWVAFNIYPQIYKIKSNGDSLTQLTSGGGSFYPRWSPDGTQIVFNGNTLFNVINRDGSGLRRIGDTMFGAATDWHPDGSKLLGIKAYSAMSIARQISTWNIPTNQIGQIVLRFEREGVGRALYSPDGSRICFNGERGIWVINSDGSGLKRILPNDKSPDRFPDFKGGIRLIVGMPSWHPDGQHLLYAHFKVTRYVTRDGIITGNRVGVEGYYSLYKVHVDSTIAVSTLPN